MKRGDSKVAKTDKVMEAVELKRINVYTRFKGNRSDVNTFEWIANQNIPPIYLNKLEIRAAVYNKEEPVRIGDYNTGKQVLPILADEAGHSKDINVYMNGKRGTEGRILSEERYVKWGNGLYTRSEIKFIQESLKKNNLSESSIEESGKKQEVFNMAREIKNGLYDIVKNNYREPNDERYLREQFNKVMDSCEDIISVLSEIQAKYAGEHIVSALDDVRSFAESLEYLVNVY